MLLTCIRSGALAWSAAVAAALTLATTVAPSAALADEHHEERAVIVQTNDTFANAIIAYARSGDGTLALAGRYPDVGPQGHQRLPP